MVYEETNTCSQRLHYHSDPQIVYVSEMEATLERELALKPGSSVVQMSCDPKGSVLVVVDDQNVVTAFDPEQDTSVTLPSYSSPVTAVGVQPVTLDIVVVYSDMMIKEYSYTTQKYTTFCRESLSTPSSDLTKRNSVICNVSFDSRNPNLILLHDDSCIIVLDKGKEVTNEKLKKPAKIKRWEPSENSNSSSCSNSVKVGATGVFSFVRRSNQIIHFSGLKNESVVSVELNPLQLLEKLPPTLKIKKFGGV